MARIPRPVVVILQTVLGQTFHTFADNNDGGRDGAFFGKWSQSPQTDPTVIPAAVVAASSTVAQCKFSVKSRGNSDASVTEERTRQD